MSALSAVLSTRVGRRRKFGEVSCTECTVQGNYFELIPTVEMKTIHHVEGYFSSEFHEICNHCGSFSVTYTREHRQNAPKTECNIRLKSSFKPNNESAF